MSDLIELKIKTLMTQLESDQQNPVQGVGEAGRAGREDQSGEMISQQR